MNTGPRDLQIQTAGEIETCRMDIQRLRDSMNTFRLWRPATGLSKQCQVALEGIDALSERVHQALVVTLVGPSGAGKSTLFNALAGVDDLSAVGTRRPTTRTITLLGRDPATVRSLEEALGRAADPIETRLLSSVPKEVLLLDTPDIDTLEANATLAAVQTSVGLSDVLICVFDAENPRRKDLIDSLAPYIRRFEGHSILVVLNKCDRLSPQELTGRIVPEFEELLQTAWEKTRTTVLYASAKNNLRHPHWDSAAGPKHELDQFSTLRELVFEKFSQPGFGLDRRRANARHLRNYVIRQTRSEASKHRGSLETARQKIQTMQQQAFHDALAGLEDQKAQTAGTQVLLYQRLAQKWVGPIGWVIALWARLLVFGAGLAGLIRFGNPVGQLMGAVSSYRHYRETRAALEKSQQPEWLSMALKRFQAVQMKAWPDIAEYLVKSGFDDSVRHPEIYLTEPDRFSEDLSAVWGHALEASLARTVRRLANPFLQLVCNLPVLALLIYVGWITLYTFYTAEYLSTDFFVHAFIALGIVLSLIFFIFQLLVGGLGRPRRLLHTAFEAARQKADQSGDWFLHPIVSEMEKVLHLCQLDPSVDVDG